MFGDVVTYPSYESTAASKGFWHHYALVRYNNVVKSSIAMAQKQISKNHTGSIGSTNTTAIGDVNTGAAYPAKGKISNLE